MTKPTEHDHRAALAANLDRIGLPAYAEAVRRLPVLVTCGACAHCTGPAGETWCDLDLTGPTEDTRCRDVDSADAPPEWCPLRGEQP